LGCPQILVGRVAIKGQHLKGSAAQGAYGPKVSLIKSENSPSSIPIGKNDNRKVCKAQFQVGILLINVTSPRVFHLSKTLNSEAACR